MAVATRLCATPAAPAAPVPLASLPCHSGFLAHCPLSHLHSLCTSFTPSQEEEDLEDTESLADGYASVASGLASSLPSGIETPAEIDLRKTSEGELQFVSVVSCYAQLLVAVCSYCAQDLGR